jgi:predicted transporter
MALARLRRHLEAGWRRLLPWRELARIGAASLAAALPVAALAPGLPRAAFSTLAILGVVYAAALALVLIGFGILTADEIPAPVRRLLLAAGWRPRIEPSESR